MLLSSPTGFIEPCLPSPAERPPTGPEWVHEIKHDGYRLMARRDPIGIRLLTRNGHDWSPRYPLIVEAVDRLRVRSCLIDGEAVACDGNGLAVFEHLRRKPTGRHVLLYAFDLLELDGEDSAARAVRDPQGDAGEPAAREPAGAAGQRAPDASRRGGVPACLQDGARGHRVEAAGLALHLGPVEGLAQVQEPGCAGGEARGGRGLRPKEKPLACGQRRGDGTSIAAVANATARGPLVLHVSERRACAALGQHRSTQRKVPRGREDEERLTADIIELAQQYGRYGYRKVAGLLRQAGWIINRSGRRVRGTGGQIQMLRQIM